MRLALASAWHVPAASHGTTSRTTTLAAPACTACVRRGHDHAHRLRRPGHRLPRVPLPPATRSVRDRDHHLSLGRFGASRDLQRGPLHEARAHGSGVVSGATWDDGAARTLRPRRHSDIHWPGRQPLRLRTSPSAQLYVRLLRVRRNERGSGRRRRRKCLRRRSRVSGADLSHRIQRLELNEHAAGSRVSVARICGGRARPAVHRSRRDISRRHSGAGAGSGEGTQTRRPEHRAGESCSRTQRPPPRGRHHSLFG